ncbi:sugar phosphate nucleotidyltransferase [Malacoplasma iowae]|uniref:sugar phosphate nucleotidyltransferase n=1 Tax=Malacoplasma iowae TaxID=2116 RepID=UPI002A189107|nr:sugar phosphate nucleotidyltransferase [Malacoplasma iowae]WPL40026.1 2-C-methyl-D-erythritol 4-phosphate cytidylyltransferase [Malacoplasma iowae]
MKVIITAAGFGTRFLNYGINIPKYLIKVKGITLLEHSLKSLGDFFNHEFIFVFRNIENENKIKEIIENTFNTKNEKIKNYKILNISHPTKGQADTVLKCDEYIKNNDEPILIFNIDTSIINPELFIKQEDIDQRFDGIIYTTKASGNHWSFAKTINNSNIVIEVAEKNRISDNASIGLYYFKSFKKFCSIVNEFENQIIKNAKELYIIPIYNYLIKNNGLVVIKEIPVDNFLPLGTPEEILKVDKNFLLENKNV